MKKYSVILFAILSVVMVSCKEKIEENLGPAPKDMSGKTLKVDGATIKFNSNSSATISDYIGVAKRSSVSYSKTSPVTANLTFFYHSEDNHSMSERNYNLELSFADETEGLASGTYTYSLTISKGTRWETSGSGSKTIKDKIFSIYE